jgi:phosphatidylinositol alpha-mannosyltransferase
MRIAIVSPYALDVVGGVQAHVLALADALRTTGDDVLVVGPSSSDGAPDRTPGGGRIVTVGRTVAVPANGSRAPIALGPAAASRMRALLRRAAPDVVHVHEPLVPVLGPVAVLATDAARVLTFHATAEGGALPRLYRAVRGPGRRVVACGDVLTAVSPVAAAFHAHALGLDRDRLTIVPNGVEVTRFTPTVAREVGTPQRLVFLGRLEHRKGADVVVRAFLRLAPERPDLELRVLGDGPLAPALRRLVADAPVGVARRIDLAGRAEPSELPGLLADADLAVLPARGGESFGIVLLEAMAAGLPLVATDIPGYRAVARHEREALLVAPGDPVALAGAVERLLDDPSLAARLRAEGRVRAAEHDWRVIAARMRELYVEARTRVAARSSDR